MDEFSDVWPAIPWGQLGYKPNLAQQPIVECDSRMILICGGERSGKSLTAAALFLKRCLIKDGVFWIIGPDYEHSRKEFEYIEQSLGGLGFIDKLSKPMEGTWRMETKWGASITTRSSNKERSIASEALDGALLTEAGQQTEEAWLKTRGRVIDKRGFVVLSGTLEDGFPWYIDMLSRWKGANTEGGRSFSLPTWSNLDLFPGGHDDPEMVSLRSTMSLSRFNEKYGAIPSKPSGLVFPQFEFDIHVRELNLALDDNLKPFPVELAIDPATHTYAVLFIQKVGRYIHVLDEVYTHGQIAQEVIPQVMAHPLWSYVTGGVIDVAGRQRHGTHSQETIWFEETGIALRSKYWDEPDVRDAVALRLQKDPMLEEPTLFFNACLTNARAADGRVAGVLAEMGMWRWRDTAYNRSEARRPIDANNDALKALGYYLLDVFGFNRTQRKIAKGKKKKGFGYGRQVGLGQNSRMHTLHR